MEGAACVDKACCHMAYGLHHGHNHPPFCHSEMGDIPLGNCTAGKSLKRLGGGVRLINAKTVALFKTKF